VFAEPVANALADIRTIQELRRMLVDRNIETKVLQQADALFFYREIALGIFHQVSNHLDHASSDLLVVQTLTESRGDARAKIQNHTQEAKIHLRSAKELIERAHTRGKIVAPVGRNCLLLKNVVRPAIDYAKKKAPGTGVVIDHSLTNSDFPVFLDPELATEVINVINKRSGR
jgi:hypothetical protein